MQSLIFSRPCSPSNRTSEASEHVGIPRPRRSTGRRASGAARGPRPDMPWTVSRCRKRERLPELSVEANCPGKSRLAEYNLGHLEWSSKSPARLHWVHLQLQSDLIPCPSRSRISSRRTPRLYQLGPRRTCSWIAEDDGQFLQLWQVDVL